jgi:hypothetical protein
MATPMQLNNKIKVFQKSTFLFLYNFKKTPFSIHHFKNSETRHTGVKSDLGCVCSGGGQRKPVYYVHPEHWKPEAGVLVRKLSQLTSVPDPDPPDPHVFGTPGSRSTSQRYGSGPGSGSFYHHAKIVRKTLIPSILRLFLIFYL